MRTLYGLASCDTCRKARAWLDSHGVDYRYHDVRADGLDATDLQAWSAKLGWETLVNKRSTTWRGLPDDLRSAMNETTAIAALLEYPTLLKRPVLFGHDVLEIGFRPERYSALF